MASWTNSNFIIVNFKASFSMKHKHTHTHTHANTHTQTHSHYIIMSSMIHA